MDRTDDEDWLYRRGRYADEPGAERPEAIDEPWRPAEAPHHEPPTTYGTPTPVGHYGGQVPPATATPQPVGPLPGEPPRRPTRQGGARGERPGRRPATHGAVRAERPPRPRRRRPRFLLWVVALLALYLVGIPLVAFALTPRTDATPDGGRPADTPGHVFVLAGSDSREGLSTEEQNRLGTGSDAGKRTDSIMLLYVPPTGRASLVSVPRDSYVAIPGHGRNKINAAYSFGGPELLVETIEENTGLRVDGYVEIGFGGFANVVDALGGIEMCPARAIKDRDSNLDIPAGCQEMDGATALGYVRMRKADPEGDLGRAKRQREMVGALVSKALSPATVFLPWRWWGLNWTTAQALTFGDGNGIGETLGLGSAAIRMGTGQGDMLVVPVGETNAQTSAGSSVLWDKQRSRALFDAMARGEGDLRPYAS